MPFCNESMFLLGNWKKMFSMCYWLDISICRIMTINILHMTKCRLYLVFFFNLKFRKSNVLLLSSWNGTSSYFFCTTNLWYFALKTPRCSLYSLHKTRNMCMLEVLIRCLIDIIFLGTQLVDLLIICKHPCTYCSLVVN